MKDNLIICLSSGYKKSHLKPFVRTSLDKLTSKTRKVMFIENPDKELRVYLEDHCFELIEYSAKYPFFSNPVYAGKLNEVLPDSFESIKIKPHLLRFLFYKVFIEINGLDFSGVMHTDTRDVIFQGDPFCTPTAGLELYLENENVSIEGETYNKEWIEAAYGIEVLNEIGKFPISCCGVVISDPVNFKVYVNSMVAEIIGNINTTSMEQGAHNYLIWSGKLAKQCTVRIFHEGFGRVATIGICDGLRAKIVGESVFTEDNQLFPVVHQYDRHPRLLRRYNKYNYILKVIYLWRAKLRTLLIPDIIWQRLKSKLS